MELKIHDYKLLCNKGSADFNEDIIGLSPYGAWVLDGATGLNNKNLISDESDAKWYVNWWNKYLHDNMKRNVSLKEIMKDGIDEISKEYHKLVGDTKVESLDFPSCACSIIKFYENKIEYLILGDCTLLINNKDCIKTFKDDAISKLDKKVYDYMSEIENSKNMTFNERKDKVMHIIIENRLKKNTIGGYWSLEFSKDAIDNCVNGFIDIDNDMKIMMTSDGFSCAYDRYDIFSEEDIINIANTEGIDYIYKKMREFEKSDEKGVKYPRFKVHDDSSCVYLNIYKD